jgi:hypothetical protein
MTAEPERTRRRFPWRDEVWGDEPHEVDASQYVEELESAQPELARRWHDHAALVAMLVLPGPGVLVIIAGLAILATEYVWAQRLLRIARERFEQAKDVVLRKNRQQPESDPEP